MRKWVIRGLSALLFLILVGAGGLLALLWYFGRDLPDYQQLASYEPAVMTRVHAGDGRILAEFAVERRLFVPIKSIPRRVIEAFLAAEDKTFYSHPGISVPDIARALLTNVRNAGAGQARRPVGASTITQQVAKNFLLTNELSIDRKVKEAMLAFRIEQVLSKDRILELYLNEIYLGFGAYGIAAAALNYFDKPLDELDTAEIALLAALPKAPNNYHPLRFPDLAKSRRDWVIGRMVEDGWLTESAAAAARARPIQLRSRAETEIAHGGDYFAEEVRRELMARFGEAQLYKGGLSVHATLDPRLQDYAEKALRQGLIAYDRRHGWRGPIAQIAITPGWEGRLRATAKPPGLSPWLPAVVLATSDAGAEIGLADGSRGLIPFAEMSWARQTRDDQRLGPPIRHAREVVSPGDVVAVEPLAAANATARQPAGTHALRQIPNLGGAIVALDPHTGRVLAMAGGFSYEISQFNRATQALRQPGSSFKPFVYLAALDAGFTPASVILDAPVALDQGPGLPLWKPKNYSGNFLGPATLRTGIELSRNLMTVRLANDIGMQRVVELTERLGIVDDMPAVLSASLGSVETTLLRLTAAYGMIANGGLRLMPTLIDRVQDRNGRTIYRHDERQCDGCRAEQWAGQPVPRLADRRERVIDAGSAYQMIAIMEGVVQRGTAARLRALGKPMAGKTGTTNDSNDAWFVGFTPNLVTGVFMGMDAPRTLGPNEQGASVAVPVFQAFMAEALKDQPAIPFRMPPGVRQVRINRLTGMPAQPGERDVIWEAFKPGTEPGFGRQVLDGLTVDSGAITPTPRNAIPASGTGGLY